MDRATIDAGPLAEFEHRQTLRYRRFYPVPMERVWRAVTRSEALDVWLMPVCRVEPREGGRCSFSWGRPEDASVEGRVSVFEPMTRVRYDTPAGHLEFRLEPAEGGTRLAFVQWFRPGYQHAEEDFHPEDPGNVDPIAGGSPWRTGFVAGFHWALDGLGTFLAADASDAEVARSSAGSVERANAVGQSAVLEEPPYSDFLALLERYRVHLRDTWPRD